MSPTPHSSFPTRKPTTALEAAARTALESLAARRFTDSEWQQMRSRLLQFANLLHQWEYLPFSRKAAIAQPAWNEAA